ncbi:MAG: hypothetical protein IT289_04875 [Oligoflexia bacterium]|nr:hypothetical protein [Oligoflexia bacterium]
MDNLIVKLILIAALLQLGLSLSSFENCHSRQCLSRFERLSRAIVKVKWRPISIFKEEAQRFH